MGVYYHIANYDKKQVIDLSDVASIKRGAYSSWSLQGAILNTFLGFSWPHLEIYLGPWVGHWAKDAIMIESTQHPGESERWMKVDAGMAFLADLHQHGKLDIWVPSVHLALWNIDGNQYELNQWTKDNPDWKSMIPEEGAMVL